MLSTKLSQVNALPIIFIPIAPTINEIIDRNKFNTEPETLFIFQLIYNLNISLSAQINNIMKYSRLFLLVFIYVFILSCRSYQSEKSTFEHLINLREYYYPVGSLLAGKAYCYSDEHMVPKKYEIIKDSIIDTDTFLVTVTYDSAFNPISKDVMLLTANLLIHKSMQIYTRTGTVPLIIDSSYNPWIQPIQTDSNTAFSATSIALNADTTQVTIGIHCELSTEIVKGYDITNCVKVVYFTTIQSPKEVGGKKSVEMKFDEIDAKGIGPVAYIETTSGNIRKYYLAKIIPLPDFYALLPR